MLHRPVKTLFLTTGGCSSGDSCSEWTHPDSPETVGGRSQCQLSEQGDDCECAVVILCISENLWTPLCNGTFSYLIARPSHKEMLKYKRKEIHFFSQICIIILTKILVYDKFVNGTYLW